MSDLIEATTGQRLTTSALRAYGRWDETKYEFHTAPTGQAIAVKRFTWVQAAVTTHGGFPLELSYFATATADPHKLDDLVYLAALERSALDVLETMVLLALQGTAYLALPHPVVEVQKDVLQVVGEWIRQRGYPEDWAAQLQAVIGQAFARLKVWKDRLVEMQTRLDPEHQAWGLAVPIQSIEPREATA